MLINRKIMSLKCEATNYIWKRRVCSGLLWSRLVQITISPHCYHYTITSNNTTTAKSGVILWSYDPLIDELSQNCNPEIWRHNHFKLYNSKQLCDFGYGLKLVTNYICRTHKTVFWWATVKMSLAITRSVELWVGVVTWNMEKFGLQCGGWYVLDNCPEWGHYRV